MNEELVEKSAGTIHWLRRYSARFVIVLGFLLIVVYALQPNWLAPITMVPAWSWLVPVFIAVVLIRHQLVWIFAAWLMFAVLHVEECRSLSRSLISVDTVSADSIRVASINCNVGKTKSALEALAEKPDIVLMQESPGFESLAVNGFQDAAIPVDVVWAGDNSIAVFGSIETVLADTSLHFCHVAATLSNGVTVDVVSLRLSPPVFRIDFWTADFWRDHYNKRIEHKGQLEEIVEHLRQHQKSNYLIVGGDFNSVAGDGVLSTTLTDLEDSFVRGGRGWGATGTNDFSVFRVDQIWSSSNLQSLSSRSLKTQNSDHRMVVADFRVVK